MKKKRLYLFTIIAYGMCTLFASAPALHAQEKTETKKEFVHADSLTTSLFKKLSSITNTLASLIAQGRCNPRNKQETLEWLAEISKLIGKSQKNQYSTITHETLAQKIALARTIAGWLDLVIRYDFATLPIITEDAFVGRVFGTNPTITEINYQQEVTNQLITKLQEDADQAGLTWYNKSYRWITGLDQRGLFAPTAKLLGVGAGIAASTALVAAFVLGSKKIDGVLGQDTSDEVRARLTTMAIGGAATTLWGISVGGLINTYKSLKLGEKASIAHNWLKGNQINGSSNQTQYIQDDITLDNPLFDDIRANLSPLYDMAEFVVNPKKYASTGRNIAKAVLAYGPSGCGKSYALTALASTINNKLADAGEYRRVGFIKVTQDDLIDFGLEVIKDIFDRAKANAPCIVFFDEIHLMGLQKNGNNKILSEMLIALDDLAKNNDPEKQILVVGASNAAEQLDDALLRPGRFGTKIKFSQPSYNQRKNLLERLCKQYAIDTTNIDFNFFAEITKGTSYSDLNYMFTKAGFIAKSMAEGITSEHLYQALGENIRKLGKKSPLLKRERTIVATHIAGKTLGYCLLPESNALESATILPAQPPIIEKYDWQVKQEQAEAKKPFEDKQKLVHGAVFFCDQSEEISQESLETSCKHYLSGLVAQKLLNKRVVFSSQDRQEALLVAQGMLLDGLKFEHLSKDDQNLIKSQAYKQVKQYEQELEKLFEKNKEKIIILRDLLLEKEFVRANEIYDVLGLEKNLGNLS